MATFPDIYAPTAPEVAPIPTSWLGRPNVPSIAFFLLIVTLTLYVTYWASRKTRTAAEYYTAGRNVSALQNGLALVGDYLSAASFLGIAGLVALKGYDGMIYATGWIVGWPVLLCLFAEPLRNLGKFTFSDVVALRLKARPVRVAASVGGILSVLFYAIAQMVGSGDLVRLMLGIPYEAAVIVVGSIMLAYVLFGGMLATTWAQIVKAALLLGAATILTLLALGRFGFNPARLLGEVREVCGPEALAPGNLFSSPVEAVSLGLALMFGLLGLPHILMRFYTVPDARAARLSALWATGFLAYFYAIIPVVGFAAAVLVGRSHIVSVDAGGNMALPLLAELLGGTPLLGLVAAVAFATVIAVMAGLTLAGASFYAHDLYACVLRRGEASEAEQFTAAKRATLAIGIAAILLGIFFKGQNVAFMVGLAFAIAASANFPALVLSIFWKRFTTAGAVASILAGAALSVGMIVLSPTVWVEILGFDEAVVPLRNPAVVSMPAAFLAGIVVSLLRREPRAEAAFEEEKLRTYLGVGAE